MKRIARHLCPGCDCYTLGRSGICSNRGWPHYCPHATQGHGPTFVKTACAA